MVIPAFIVLFIPLLIGAKHLWFWSRRPSRSRKSDAASCSSTSALYLNHGILPRCRAAVYFAVLARPFASACEGLVAAPGRVGRIRR